MVTHYSSEGYDQLCESQVGNTTSLLLAKATDDVKLKVSVLLTSNPLRNLYETQILGPFRRFRRFQLPRNQTIKAYYFHQYNCSAYENCGCESIPEQDRVDITRRYKVYNESGQTKLSDIFNQVQPNQHNTPAPLPLKILALTVTQELHKRWVLSKKNLPIIITQFFDDYKRFFFNLRLMFLFQ